MHFRTRACLHAFARRNSHTRKKLPREGCPKTCDATAPFSGPVITFPHSRVACLSANPAKPSGPSDGANPKERLASDGTGTVALLSGPQHDPNGTGAAALPLPLQGPASWGQKRIPSGGVRPRGPSSASRVA